MFIALCLLYTPIPHPEIGTFHSDTNHTGSRATGNYLFLYLYLGSSRHIRTLRIRRLVYRNAEFTLPMYIAITQNIVNIVASLSFVYLLDMKVAGVATGTLIAQYARFLHGHYCYICTIIVY